MRPLYFSSILKGDDIVNDELINSNEIYIQDMVCTVVASNPRADDFALYNQISTMINIESLETVSRILSLIKINKIAFNN